MVKVAIINDTHMGARKNNPIVNEYFFKFWNNVFFPYLKNNNIKRIFHLGDFVDDKKFMNYQIYNSWRLNLIEKSFHLGLEWDMMVGNHDVPYKNTNTPNALEELFSGLPNVRIYTSPKDIIIDGQNFAFIPWINDENFSVVASYIRKTKAKIAFGHFELNGFEMDKGNICKTGIDVKNLELDKFEKVFSGHFHHKSDNGHIFYLGTQYQITWADADDIKGFHVFDTDTHEIEFIQNPYILFHKIKYNDSVTLPDIKDLSKYSGTYIKLYVLNRANHSHYDKYLQALNVVEPISIQVIEDSYSITRMEEDLENEEFAFDEEEFTDVQDTLILLKKYVDNQNFDSENKTVDKEKVFNRLHEIYLLALDMKESK